MPINVELQVVASLLRRGRTLDQLSTGLTLLGVLFGVLQLLLFTSVVLGQTLSAWLIVVGLIQKYWAIRVAFDAACLSWSPAMPMCCSTALKPSTRSYNISACNQPIVRVGRGPNVSAAR